MGFTIWKEKSRKASQIPKAVALTSCRAGPEGDGEGALEGRSWDMVAENKSPLLGTTP